MTAHIHTSPAAVRLAFLLGTTAIVSVFAGCRGVERMAVKVLDKAPETPTGALTAEFDGADEAREQVKVALVPVAEGFSQLTDVQPVPGTPGTCLLYTSPSPRD